MPILWPDQPLRVICAWCPEFNPTAPANENATHGICERCIARMEAEARDRRIHDLIRNPHRS